MTGTPKKTKKPITNKLGSRPSTMDFTAAEKGLLDYCVDQGLYTKDLLNVDNEKLMKGILPYIKQKNTHWEPFEVDLMTIQTTFYKRLATHIKTKITNKHQDKHDDRVKLHVNLM